MRAGLVGLGTEREWHCTGTGLDWLLSKAVRFGSDQRRGLPVESLSCTGLVDIRLHNPGRRATNGRLTTGTDYGTPTF